VPILETERYQMHLKFLEKQEQAKPKIHRRRAIIKLRVQIKEIETKKKKKTIKMIIVTKVSSLKRTN
jgi:hypothetical protein